MAFKPYENAATKLHLSRRSLSRRSLLAIQTRSVDEMDTFSNEEKNSLNEKK